MKKLYFILLLLFSSSLFAQYTSTGIGRWRLGLNVGGTWQTANINSKLLDVGYGATLEYAVHETHNSFFGFSLRGRWLGGQTRGFNKLREYGAISNDNINGIADTNFNYSNIPVHLNNRTRYNEFSLEAMLKWNRLYQNHGIVFYLYAGAGFTHFKVETNQLNEFDFMYDYSTIPEGTSNTIDEIGLLHDNTYETELVNPDYKSLVFTPSLGLGFGFRVTRGFDIVWEHKTSLPQTDLFEGQTRETDDPSFVKDIYHYTSIGFIFNIIGYHEPIAYEPPVEPSEPVVTPTTNPTTPVISKPTKPTINLIKPTSNSFNSPNCEVKIEAKIENVKSQNEIEFYHNGNKVASYKYFYTPNIFKSTIQLKEGENEFKIIAKNEQFSETETFSLTCNNIKTIEICHKEPNGKSSTIFIKENEWATHAAHGDTKGKCPPTQVNMITICHNIPGQGGKTQTISIPESEWSIHQSHGDYKGTCSEKKMITICHQNQEITIDEKDWAFHAAHGDTKGKCPPPQVNMITICHIPESGNKRITMTIPENEWLVHQAHGDYKGSCPSVEPMISICHKNPNGTKTNLTIPEFRWNEHFAHGDTKGKCPEKTFIICHTDPVTKKKQNISITESLWAAHAAHGDTKGECPKAEKMITICHNIPGKVGQKQTITIPESQWMIHKSHGDVLGECKKIENIPTRKITICHNVPGQRGVTQTMTIDEKDWAVHAAHGDTKGKCPEKMIQICHKFGNQLINMTIKESEWPAHAAHGDTKGFCPKDNSTNDPKGTGSGTGTGSTGNLGNKKITICHKVPGQRGVTQTMVIYEKDWPVHAAHGDTKGKCPEKTIQICHKSGNKLVDMNIKESEWSSHAAHGDTKGFCPKDNSTNDPNGAGTGTGTGTGSGTGTNGRGPRQNTGKTLNKKNVKLNKGGG